MISLLSKGVPSLIQNHNLKISILWHLAFFIFQLSHLYMTTGKTIALIVWTFVGKVMSLLFNMLSMFVIAFLPRSKHLLISQLQSIHSDVGAQERKISHNRLQVTLPYNNLKLHEHFQSTLLSFS